MARPIPRLPPVTRTLRIDPLQLAAGGHGQRRHEAKHRRNLVRREIAATGRQDLGLDRAPRRSAASANTTSATTIAPVIGLRRPLTTRHPHGGVTVDHRLDLLGMNLQAADIDDAAAAADEMVAVASPLDHVAGVDEAVGVDQRPLIVRPTIAVAVRAERSRSEPSTTRISTSPALLADERLPGKPSSPSFTSKPTPASVEA